MESRQVKSAAERRQMARKKRLARQRMINLVTILFLLALIVGIALIIKNCHPKETAAPATIPAPQPSEPVVAPKPQLTWKTYPEDRQITAKQYFVYDLTQQKYLVSSGDTKVYPASITKLFSAYVALQYLDAEEVITSPDIRELVMPGSSVAGIEAAEKLTVEKLVEAMLLPSGNDAAYVLAVVAGHRIGSGNLSPYSAANLFVERMNALAKEKGMTGSHFANPDGIHESNHYTTYHDLTIMAALALENPTIAKYANTANGSRTMMYEGKEVPWKNTNALIQENSEYYCPYAIGLKTGQTPSAGSCLLSAFQVEDTTLIIGVFGCPDVNDRFDDTLQLFNDFWKTKYPVE